MAKLLCCKQEIPLESHSKTDSFSSTFAEVDFANQPFQITSDSDENNRSKMF